MATIKSFTDISQSKKLTKILPLESADMCCFQNPNGDINYYGFPFLQGNKASNPIPCWSLSALLCVLPYPFLSELSNGIWKCGCYPSGICNYVTADSPIDACYEMILKLNELNLL